ncbi:hypothetical protein [Flavobacterium magnesitis]|uniref:hypothetical protein n=1 Tax=Flavobacterium magnesitis TaxID=3138077 RepID=UPI00358E02D3
MIDFVKIYLKDFNPSILEGNARLDFFDKINTSTGEIKTVNHKGQKITPYKNALYNGLEFRIYDNGRTTIQGSLHKFWNSGAHNYNDFNFSAFSDVLDALKKDFGIQPEQCILNCLEVGINVTPPIPTNDILDYCFLHKTKPFEYQKNSDEGKYKQCEHSHYFVKLYNKALHYRKQGFDIESEIMRFEIKYKKMERVNNLGIYTLNDILNKGFGIFKNELLTEWQNILFYDTTIVSNSIRLTNYKNPIYWSDLVNKPTKSNYYKHRGILKDLTNKFSENRHQTLTEIMTQKIDYLDNRGASFDPLIIKSIHTPLLKTIDAINDTFCKVTKVNISMQKDSSLLLSHTGLKYYCKTDKKIFEQIKRRYLSKRWYNSDFETQIKEIAHNIRNHRSNQNIKQTKIYQSKQFNLLSNFDLETA